MRRSTVILSVVVVMLSFPGVTASCPRAYCHYLPFGGKESAVPAPTTTPTPRTPTPATPTPVTPPTAPSTRIVWSTVDEAPISRSEGQGIGVNGILYVFGGYTNTTYIPVSRRADAYDPRIDKWSELPQMPMAITHAGVATDGTNIYLAGGVVGSGNGDKIFATTAVWRYNIAARKWDSIASLPEPRGAGALAIIGRTLHFFGGTGLDRYTSEDEHWVLSLDGGTQWRPAAPLPNPRNHLSEAVVDGKLYVIGGQHGHNETLVTQRSVQMYDPALDRWSERAPLPAGRSHTTAVVRDGYIYVLGGEQEHAVPEEEVFVYNSRANTWTSATPLPLPRYSGVAANIGGTIFYSGGSLQRITYKGTFTP